MNELDKWVSDNLKLKLLFEGFEYNFKYFPYTWTLSDARCREIVREHFKINTTCGTNEELGDWYWAETAYPRNSFGRGKTIAETELACLNAIRLRDE